MLSADADQEAVLADPASRILITAPPGSGKTFTAVRLVGRDVESGRVGPTQRALVLTFSLEARTQLQRYATTLLSAEQLRRAEITNYHRFFWSKIRAFRSSLGLPDGLVLSTREEHDEDIEASMLAVRLDPKGLSVEDYGRAHEFSVPGACPERAGLPLENGEEVRAALEDRARERGRIHYDDMAYYFWRLLHGSSRLRRLWAHKYPVVILDEYQDSSPLQAMIVERLAAEGCFVYAFADPLQMIYGFRDASPSRVPEFAQSGASSHELRTLHRYRDRPELQAWFQGVREVLLEGASSCPPPPSEVTVLRYDPSERIRNEPYDTASRSLWQLLEPISRALGSADVGTVAVLLRKHTHFNRLQSKLSEGFYPRQLGSAERTAEWVRGWLDEFAAAASPELQAIHLLRIAARVAPSNDDIADLQSRLDNDGIRTARLHSGQKRDLGEAINALLGQYETLAGALAAATSLVTLATRYEDPKRVDHEAAWVLRRVLRCPRNLSDAEALERVSGRIAQVRFQTTEDARRGLYLLTCHSAKGKEFDMVVVPYLSSQVFSDDEEARQLLYVTLTRTRSQVLVRVAEGDVPEFARIIGLT